MSEIDETQAFRTKLSLIKQEIEKNGYYIFNNPNLNIELFLNVARLFGLPQSHVRANANGVVCEEESIDKAWMNYKEEYQGVQTKHFSPHTDGAFLNGVFKKDNKLFYVGPPKFLLLQCINKGASGGENILIDGKKILTDIISHRKELLSALTTRCISICRDDQLAVNIPVFEKTNNRIIMRFRYDEATYVMPNKAQALNTFYEEFIKNSKYKKNVSLQSGDVIIIDNYRMLHGREAFTDGADSSEKRVLRRIWIANENTPEYLNIKGECKDHRALLPFYHYKPINALKEKEEINIDAGIELPIHLQKEFLGPQA